MTAARRLGQPRVVEDETPVSPIAGSTAEMDRVGHCVELAGKGIPRVRNKDKGGVGACSRIAWATEPVKNEIARLKVVGGILDRRKSEGRHGGKGDRARRGCHTRRGGGKRGSPSLRKTVDR